MPIRFADQSITTNILKGSRPSERRVGLIDPELPLQPGADRFGPRFFLGINKDTIDPDSFPQIMNLIDEVTYEDNEDLFDELRIKLSGMIEDPKTGITMPIPEWVQQSTLFSQGNIVWLFGGYGGYQRLIGGAEIVDVEFSYGELPSCTIVAYEPIHRMANVFAEQGVSYPKMRSSDIVKKIGQKPEYTGTIGALFDVSKIERLPIFTPEAEKQKQGESDYEFLKRLADVRGWNLYTRYDESIGKFALLYGPDVDKQDIFFRYEYNNSQILVEDTLLAFSPKISLIDQSTEVEIVSFDEKRKKEISSKTRYKTVLDNQPERRQVGNTTDYKAKELKNPHAYRFKVFGTSKRIIANRPFKNESEAKKFVIQWARQNIKNFITGSGTVLGNESLQSRQVHYFYGLGETFSGTMSNPAKWYLSKVTHSFSKNEGYRTSFDARKVVDWLPDDDIVANIPERETDKSRKKATRYRTIFG